MCRFPFCGRTNNVVLQILPADLVTMHAWNQRDRILVSLSFHCVCVGTVILGRLEPSVAAVRHHNYARVTDRPLALYSYLLIGVIACTASYRLQSLGCFDPCTAFPSRRGTLSITAVRTNNLHF